MMSGEIEKQINQENNKTPNRAIKRIRTKLYIKIKSSKILRGEIEKKSKIQNASKAKQIIIRRIKAKIDKTTN